MGREAYLEGWNTARHLGRPDRYRYTDDPDYANGYDGYFKKHPTCPCGEEAQAGTEPPMCVGCFANKGGGNDETTKPEEE